MDDIESLAKKTVNCMYQVHQFLGPGLLESVYSEALCQELQSSFISYEKEMEIPVIYKSTTLKTTFRSDIVIEKRILIEIKSVESLQPIHFAQIMNYLKLSRISLGFLINFNCVHFKKAIHRLKF